MAHTYIVLFRGINVGGNKIVRMELLRQMLTGLGFDNVATYIQSGNVVLNSAASPAGVTPAIEDAFPGTFGFTSRPTVRSFEEWERVIGEDPFAGARTDGKQVHAVFVDEQPAATAALSVALGWCGSTVLSRGAGTGPYTTVCSAARSICS